MGERGEKKKSQQQNKPVSKLHSCEGFIHVLFEISSVPHKSRNIPEALSLAGNTNPSRATAALLLSEWFRGTKIQPRSAQIAQLQRGIWSSQSHGNGTSGQVLSTGLSSVSKPALDCHLNSLGLQHTLGDEFCLVQWRCSEVPS